MARITLNGITFDPVAQAKGLESASLRSADASQSNYVLIQTRGRLTDDQKTQLTDLGVVIHEYVDKNTYICGYQPTDLRPIRALPFVVWADVYLPSFKIAPSLRRTPTTKAPLSELLAAPSPTHDIRQVDVLLHDDVNPRAAQLKKEIATAARLSPNDLEVGRNKVRVNVQERYLNDLAALDQVRAIEEVPTRKLTNNVARTILHAQVVVNGTTYDGLRQRLQDERPSSVHRPGGQTVCAWPHQPS